MILFVSPTPTKFILATAVVALDIFPEVYFSYPLFLLAVHFEAVFEVLRVS